MDCSLLTFWLYFKGILFFYCNFQWKVEHKKKKNWDRISYLFYARALEGHNIFINVAYSDFLKDNALFIYNYSTIVL